MASVPTAADELHIEDGYGAGPVRVVEFAEFAIPDFDCPRFSTTVSTTSATSDNADNKGLLADNRRWPQARDHLEPRAIWASILAYLPNTKWTMLLTAVLAVQAVVCIALASHLYLSWRQWPDGLGRGFVKIGPAWNLETLFPAFFAAICFEAIYQVVLCVDAVRLRNLVQAIGICLNNLSMLIFVAVAMTGIVELIKSMDEHLVTQGRSPSGTQSIMHNMFVLLLTVLALGTVAGSFIVWKLSGEFTWAVYRHFNTADARLRTCYLIYEIYIALLHLDFFFLFGFWVQCMTADLMPWTIAAIILVPIHLPLAGFSAQYEYKPGQLWAISIFVIDVALIGFQLFLDYVGGRGTNDTSRTRETACGSLAVPLLLATIVLAVLCTRNFNKGLKPYLKRSRVAAGTFSDNQRRQRTAGHRMENSGQMDILPARMEIE